SITEVLTSLSTNLVDTVYASPLGAIALQWASKVRYMSQVPMADGIAGVVVSRRFFDRLPPDLQSLLVEVMGRECRRLIELTRRDNAKSMAVMKEHGVKVTFTRDSLKPQEIAEIQERAMAHLVGHLFGQEVVDRVRALVAEARARADGR
ncbi:MAG: hypothetical protein D6739_00640, partial [Nitrospirae bacterium]